MSPCVSQLVFKAKGSFITKLEAVEVGGGGWGWGWGWDGGIWVQKYAGYLSFIALGNDSSS